MTIEGHERLQRCFRAIFPGIDVDRVAEVSVANTPQWDSLASATLLSVIEQEFGVAVNPLDAADLDSFASVRDYLDNYSG